MLAPGNQRLLLSDSSSSKSTPAPVVGPIHPPTSWTNSTSALESNGVSVTVILPKNLATTTATDGSFQQQQQQGTNNGKGLYKSNGSGGGGGESSRESLKIEQEGSMTGESSAAQQQYLKDGTAKCEYCGVVGMKHAFYPKHLAFCSLQCFKSSSKKLDPIERVVKLSNMGGPRSPADLGEILPESDSDGSSRCSFNVETSRSSSSASMPYDHQKKPSKRRNKEPQKQLPIHFPSENFDWIAMLDNPGFCAVNVSTFKHVPVSNIWDNVTVGMKVEVENKDVNRLHYQIAFWVASVINIQGYKVLLRFEGFGNDSSHDFWENLCSEDVHHVGWCATKGKPLIPPNTIAAKYGDWRDFLVKRLTGARTLPQNFQAKVAHGLKSKFEIGTELEVVDKSMICRLRLARIKSRIGRRLHVLYYNTVDEEAMGFWCHEESSLIHSCGWAAAVGQEIYAPSDYSPECLPPEAFNNFPPFEHVQLQIGMKLEAIDPLNLSVICAGTVKKVLKYGYIMVRVDFYEEDSSGSDWFCYHVTSPSIFPCGFCAKNSIPLIPPYGYAKDSFKWETYLRETGAKAAPLSALNKPPVQHEFRVNMKLEAADLMDPRLLCVATVSQVIGSLLKIHFDGWEEEYDQWLDATSPDVYPVGWCELVKHRLEVPPQPPTLKKPLKPVKKPKKKSSKRPPMPILEPSKKRGKIEIRAKDGLNQVKNTLSNPISKSSSAKLSLTSLKPSTESPEPTRVPCVSKLFARKEIKPESIGAKRVSTDKDSNRNSLSGDGSEDASGLGGDGEGENVIPRLVDSPVISEMADVDPQNWTVEDVSKFLSVNDCGTYCESFSRNKLCGPKLMTLTKDQIIVLTGMKVGPAVKILDLISQLRRLVSSAKVRKSALMK